MTATNEKAIDIGQVPSPERWNVVALLAEAAVPGGIGQHEFSRPGGWLERAQTALKSRRSDIDLLGQLVEARQFKSRIVGAMGELLSAYAEVDELLDNVVGSMPEVLTDDEASTQRESNATRDSVLDIYQEAYRQVRPDSSPSGAGDATAAVLATGASHTEDRPALDAHLQAALRIGLRAAQARADGREHQERSALASAFAGSISTAPEFQPSGILRDMRNEVAYLAAALAAEALDLTPDEMTLARDAEGVSATGMDMVAAARVTDLIDLHIEALSGFAPARVALKQLADAFKQFVSNESAVRGTLDEDMGEGPERWDKIESERQAPDAENPSP